MPADGTRAPNNTVPNPTDNCANYVQARINPRRIALVRVPHIAQYKSHTPAPDAVFEETEVGALSYSIYGQLTSIFRKGSPFSYSIGNEDIKTDATGGATIVVWPRSLSRAGAACGVRPGQRPRMEPHRGQPGRPAVRQHDRWCGSTARRPRYQGGLYPSDHRTGAPCFQGPQSTLDPFGLTAIPDSRVHRHPARVRRDAEHARHLDPAGRAVHRRRLPRRHLPGPPQGTHDVHRRLLLRALTHES